MNATESNAAALGRAEDLSDDLMWRAVEQRDSTYAGRFVVAVHTTGIYCRPGCGARLPLRRNVSFFTDPEAARLAGFRACKRCKPDSAPRADEAIDRAVSYLNEHVDENVTLDRLAGIAGLSPFHLQRTFKRRLGVTPREYVHAARAERLRNRLKEGVSVSRAAYEAGYGSSSGAYEQGAARLGMTPGTYRRGAAGVMIDYVIVDSALGRLLVGATPRGVCAIALGDDDAALEQSLREEYPRAELRPGEASVRDWVQAVVAYLRGDVRMLDVPVDVDGTAFQARVWKALRELPYGSTVSYSQLARAIGAPTATRAVARACATNRVALIIPCHRVVREDGGLGGYRWGIERKRKLLETEAAPSPMVTNR